MAFDGILKQHALTLASDLREEHERLAVDEPRAAAEVRRLEGELELARLRASDLERRSAEVNQALDAVLRLLGEPVDEPVTHRPAPMTGRKRGEIGPERQAVLDLLLKNSGPMEQSVMWAKLVAADAPRAATFKSFQVMCGRMFRDGQLARPTFGVYDVVDRSPSFFPATRDVGDG